MRKPYLLILVLLLFLLSACSNKLFYGDWRLYGAEEEKDTEYILRIKEDEAELLYLTDVDWRPYRVEGYYTVEKYEKNVLKLVEKVNTNNFLIVRYGENGDIYISDGVYDVLTGKPTEEVILIGKKEE